MARILLSAATARVMLRKEQGTSLQDEYVVSLPRFPTCMYHASILCLLYRPDGEAETNSVAKVVSRANND